MVDHGKSTKRKKFHDKDKYYRLAKEQGLRSRAAFKLSQINRQFPLLNNSTKVVLDLCAAPGGWTQVAARECGASTQIVAVDILPIRKIAPRQANQEIITIVGDITTDKSKAEINRAIHSQVDVVLHDGAPNVGASYEKDAYEQMELSVHALRCATHHLKQGGAFVTKIYRSRDSHSFHWVVSQLFGQVTTYKPKASRPQSAEIFYVCQNYYKPQKIDPRLLDPKHIFELVEGDTSGGGTASGAAGESSKFHVFHKNWDKSKRQRGGYDIETMDANMRRILPLREFVEASGNMPAIRLLSTTTGFTFTCEECESKEKNQESTCKCQFFLSHPLTSPEIKECVVDLKVLNKGDFKGLMIWREKMVQALQAEKERDGEDDDGEDGSDDSSQEGETKDDDKEKNSDDEEDEVQKEIQKLRERKLREKKKLKKKERKLAAKKRRQVALGMDLNAIEVQEDDQFFSLNTLKSLKDLNKVSEVNLDQATDEQVFGRDESDDEDDEIDDIKLGEDEEAGYALRLERDLDAAYDRYLENTKDGAAKAGTKASKRSKKLMREKLAQESHEDHELLLTNPEGLSEDAKAYAELLQGPEDSDDEDSSVDEDSEGEDDGFHAEPLTPLEHETKKKKQRVAKEESNPLIHKLPDDPKAVKTARWFSNPLFASIGQAAESAQETSEAKAFADADPMSGDPEEDDVNPPPTKKRRTIDKKQQKKSEDGEEAGLDPDDILAMMPKTDKQKRHEKRLKAIARDERRQARRTKKLGEAEGEFDLAPAENDDSEEDGEAEINKMEGISEEKKHKLLQARKLIKAGMGNNIADDDKNQGFEVVEADRPLPVIDERKYDSDHEEYDSDDYARTMALGTMMLRQSKAKALVDASYNRYAWNDPDDLPEWFVDDERRHYRPQLPIPPALLQKMKEKQAALSVRPIAKVAEARARKNRKAKLKLAAAKKKAQALAGSSEMSESMKLKQISKALRSTDSKKGGKEYVVAKKGKKGVKGAVTVDKRMKNDKRAMERATKNKKGGKKGGLTGSKRRRHHS